MGSASAAAARKATDARRMPALAGWRSADRLPVLAVERDTHCSYYSKGCVDDGRPGPWVTGSGAATVRGLTRSVCRTRLRTNRRERADKQLARRRARRPATAE